MIKDLLPWSESVIRKIVNAHLAFISPVDVECDVCSRPGKGEVFDLEWHSYRMTYLYGRSGSGYHWYETETAPGGNVQTSICSHCMRDAFSRYVKSESLHLILIWGAIATVITVLLLIPALTHPAGFLGQFQESRLFKIGTFCWLGFILLFLYFGWVRWRTLAFRRNERGNILVDFLADHSKEIRKLLDVAPPWRGLDPICQEP